jgi:hypothetical protein
VRRTAALVACRLSVLFLLSAFAAAVAAADDAPRTLVRTRVEPAGPVAVGETVKIVVDALVTTWLTQGLELPTFDVPGAVVAPSDQQAAKLTETIEGATWFGVSRVYLLTPTAAGTLAIPSLTLMLHVGGAEAPIEARTPALTVTVAAPPRPPGAAHALATRKLVLTQHLDRKLAGIRVGDSVERTLSLTADGVRGMFLPPPTFDAVDGLAVYPAAPHVDDVTDDRGAFLGGRRIDAATYVVQTPGRHTLPAITVQWWNTSTQTLQTASAAAIDFGAVANPTARPELALPADEDAIVIARPWRRWRGPALVAAPLLVVTALAWLLAAPIAAIRRRVADARAEHRRAFAASEAHAFAQVTETIGRGEANAIYPAVLHWLDRLEPSGAPVTVQTLGARTGDPQLTRGLAALGAAVYGNAPARAWDPDDLAQRLTKARGRLHDAARAAHAADPLPPLNP